MVYELVRHVQAGSREGANGRIYETTVRSWVIVAAGGDVVGEYDTKREAAAHLATLTAGDNPHTYGRGTRLSSSYTIGRDGHPCPRHIAERTSTGYAAWKRGHDEFVAFGKVAK